MKVKIILNENAKKEFHDGTITNIVPNDKTISEIFVGGMVSSNWNQNVWIPSFFVKSVKVQDE